jgi:hypothetical protein
MTRARPEATTPVGTRRVADLVNGEGVRVDSTRKIAFVAGALFVITFLASIPAALFLYSPVLDHAN